MNDDKSAVEIRWLRSFLAVAEERHFSRAARRLGLAQPALTAQIQHLEEAVGQRLIDRGNRLRGLTAAGLALVPEARAILERAEGLRQVASEASAGRAGRFRVGLIPPAATGGIADVFREFGRAQPGVRIEVTVTHQDRLMALLVAGELDLVIARPEHPAPGTSLRERALCVEEQGVLLRVDDPLAVSGKAIPLRQLNGRRLLLLRDNLHFGQLLLEHSVRHDVTLYPLHEAADFATLHWMVRAGLGIAPVSLSLDAPPGLAIRPMHPRPPKLKIHAIYTSSSESLWTGDWLKLAQPMLSRASLGQRLASGA